MPALPAPGPIYAIADLDLLGERALPAAVEAMLDAGLRWIQLRAKNAGGLSLCALVEKILPLTCAAGATLWLDDRADVAALFPVAGVHLGQRDLAPGAARRVVGPDLAIGQSTHDLEQLERATADPAVDVIAVGPVFATTGKTDPDPVVGLAFLRAARRKTSKTLVAIGGIGEHNLASVLAAGADTAAVLGAVCRGDVATNCARLLAAAEAEA